MRKIWNTITRLWLSIPILNIMKGRENADLTGWLTYFIGLVAKVFRAALDEALRLKELPPDLEPELMRGLDHRFRRILGLFGQQDTITASQGSEGIRAIGADGA